MILCALMIAMDVLVVARVPLKVLHFYKTYFPDTIGGVEQFICHLCSNTQDFGVQSKVLTLSKNPTPSELQWQNHSVYRAQENFSIASTGFSMAAVAKFARLANDVDIIHYHFPWPFMDLLHFMAKIRKPTVLTYHSDIIRQKHFLKIYRPLQKLFLKQMNVIVATSANYAKTSPVLQHFCNKVEVIPIGLDKNKYPMPTKERLQYWQAKIGGSRFFLFVGMLRYYKGLHVLLNALKNLDYPMMIVGTGPEEKALQAQAQELGLQQVHFLGALSEEDKVALLQQCFAMVFPSHLRSEAFGISLVESAMFGKPMISCEIGTGTTFINIANETGLVVQPSDVIGLRRAMTALWENPMQAAHMGANALRRYEQYFTASKMTQAYVDLYRRLVSKSVQEPVLTSQSHFAL